MNQFRARIEITVPHLNQLEDFRFFFKGKLWSGSHFATALHEKLWSGIYFSFVLYFLVRDDAWVVDNISIAEDVRDLD